ncbi:hypothetical protein [Sinomonas sp. R1AF57]|uniref:hypothetical protein n=1 Tax=Sinomonas sp. R1AF57 TaxID=2020377 RepID=UPI001ABF9EC3|nr:hypothetical protein [Sinomonas sp. R1AF57]
MNEALPAVRDRNAPSPGASSGPLYLLIASEASACYELDTIAKLVESIAKLAHAGEHREDRRHRPRPRLQAEEEDVFE